MNMNRKEENLELEKKQSEILQKICDEISESRRLINWTEDIKTISLNFKNYYLKTLKLIQEAERISAKISEIRKENKKIEKTQSQVYRELLETRKAILTHTEMKEFFIILEQYQQSLFEILGKELKMIIMVENERGEPIICPVGQELVKVVPKISSKGKLVGSYQILQSSIANQKTLSINSFENLNSTYQEVKQRFYQTRTKRGVGHVFWQNNIGKKKYHSIMVQSFGSIAEAYTYFVLGQFPDNDYTPSFNGSEEENVQEYAEHGILIVDNASGLLKGDIENGLIEYGVKTYGASFMGISQVYDIADQLSENTGQKVKEILEAQLNKNMLEKKYINKVDKKLSSNLRNKITKYLKAKNLTN